MTVKCRAQCTHLISEQYIMGTLAVVAIYVLARVGYGRRVAILAGILAMGSDVLIQFSRLGVNNI